MKEIEQIKAERREKKGKVWNKRREEKRKEEEKKRREKKKKRKEEEEKRRRREKKKRKEERETFNWMNEYLKLLFYIGQYQCIINKILL